MQCALSGRYIQVLCNFRFLRRIPFLIHVSFILSSNLDFLNSRFEGGPRILWNNFFCFFRIKERCTNQTVNTPFYMLICILQIYLYIPTRQSTLHGVLVHDFRRYSARFPVISACGLFRYRYSGFC